MATLPNLLPKLADDPRGASLGLELPAGRLIDTTDAGPWHEPLLWCADQRAEPGGWTALEPARRTAGLLPLVIDVAGGHGGPEDWQLAPADSSYPGDHDPEEVLTDSWHACAPDTTPWPGLTHRPTPTPSPTLSPSPSSDPDSVAAHIADSLLANAGSDPRLALVPARRSADVPAAIGWMGPANHEDDPGRLCAVLRSWEDRFGIRVVALGFDHLLVSVATPPTTLADAEALAAEHFAFCPDNFWQDGDPTPREYAERKILHQPTWHFCWE
ncbi:DUF4253 domain-containing protein [Streptomyces sp. NPDC005263]|uniref:DUF4253 domain-containing protein n=1 Tax=Streptomyces sp. NPDC005263 TaxID=3364711 RepID=UPI0036A4BBD0